MNMTHTGLLLRQFPEGARVTDNFKLCRYNPCPRPKCPFAHNKTELREWNQLQEERLARSNGKLQKCLIL